ncbi:MAG: TIM-barrel domain-containing protein [Oscillochloridaceae bacterium umkhey_bin13]
MHSFLQRVALRGQPLADPAATVNFGERRITVLTPRLLRLQWAPHANHDDRPSFAFPSRFAPALAFQIHATDDQLTLTTAFLHLSLQGRTGPFSANNLAVTLQVANPKAASPSTAIQNPKPKIQNPITWHPGAADHANLRGARRTLDNCRGEAALDPGLLSREGWALHDDSQAIRFDPATGWVQSLPDQPIQDWYLFAYGHDYPAALADYARFGGQVPMLPRWALGAWWSRYWPYHDAALRELVNQFAEHHFPLDVLVIDMDWHTPHGWTGYTWNRELFPDPPALLAWLRDQGLRTTLNLHPADGVQLHEAAHPAMAAALGRDPQQSIPFQISDPAFAQAYFELLHHPHEDAGVRFWWMDWQQGQTSELPGLDPLPWLNHLHFQDMRRRPALRPLTFSRWGGLGNHRYPLGFSGDTYATWEALRFQPHFTASAANVLFGWWSHDIGGHFDACAPELFVRWVQLGAFSPILRLHSTNDAQAERRPWAFPPAYAEAARQAFATRYALIPYLYTLARQQHDHALAPCRPLAYRWPEYDDAYIAREQFLLGDDLLVAPVVHPADPASGLAPVEVWLPPGTWIERTTGEQFTGPRWLQRLADLNTTPQFVSAGTILPLAPPAQRSHSQPRDQLILAIYPGPHGATRFYDDAGEGEHYLTGSYLWTPVTMQTTPDGCRCTVSLGPSEGACPELPAVCAYTLWFEHVNPPAQVWLDQTPLTDWHYDPASQRLSLSLPARPRSQPIVVTISTTESLSRAGSTNQARAKHDAERMLMARLGAADTGTPDPALRQGITLPQAEPPSTDLLTMVLEAASRLVIPNLADAPIATPPYLYTSPPLHLNAALARLGGPFARLYAHTTPEEARNTLGSLVIAAPHDQTAIHVAGHWHLRGPEGLVTHPFDLGELVSDTMLTAPFAWQGDLATRRWGVSGQINWRDQPIAFSFTAPILFPTIGVWQTIAAPADQPYALDQLLDANGAPRQDQHLTWQVAIQATTGLQSLTERYNVPLGAYADAANGATVIGYAVTSLYSPDQRRVRIAYQCTEPVELTLNGKPIASAHVVTVSPLRVNPDWSYSEPVELQAGRNYLMVSSCKLRLSSGSCALLVIPSVHLFV